VADELARGRIDRSVLDDAQVSIIVTDLSGRIVDCNRHAETLYGRPREEVVGSDAAEFAVDLPAPAVLDEIGERLTAGETWEGEFRVRRADGAVVDVHAIDSPVLDADGRLEGIVSIATDVTARRRAERRLAAQHAATRVLAEAATLTEASERILPVVCAALGWQQSAMWDLDPEEPVLRCVEVWGAPGVPPAFAELTRRYRFPPGTGLPGRVWSSGAPAWIPDVVRDDNFPRAPAAAESDLHGAFGVPVRGAGGEFLGVLEFLGTAIEEPDQELLDMMESVGTQFGQFIQRQRVDEQVRESEARKSAVIEAALDCVVSIDHEGRITEFNPAAERTFGYSRSDVLGCVMGELIVPRSLRETHYRGFARYLETGEGPILGQRVEITALRRDGSQFPVELTVTRVDVPGPPSFTGYVRDITERKAAERALRESHERFAQLAGTLQESLLPPELPDVPGVDLAAAYLPGGAGERIGGDFYDVFERARGDWSIVIGDVCGKGPQAAALTALTRYTIRAAAMRATRPSSILSELNQAVLRQHPERFCTAVYARLRRLPSGARLTVASGGHPLPLRIDAGGRVEKIGRPGRLLGVTPDCRLSDTVTDLAPGDVVVLYTDGVTEARRRDAGRFGEERLAALVAAPGLDPGTIVRRVEEAVLGFQEGDQQDDVALVALRVAS
jgi:PAS domain S-box-containing protein